MTSPLTRKSLRELARHRIRSILSIITIAAAVTGLWLFAIPVGLDDSLAQRGETDRIHDIRISPNNLRYVPEPTKLPPADEMVSAAELDGLAALPNVAAVETRPIMWTQMGIGGDVHDVRMIGVEDFSEQQVNVVSIEDGAAPATSPLTDEAVLDVASVRAGGLDAAPGTQIALKAGDGDFYPFVVSGLGGTIRWSGQAADIGPVVYVPAETVRILTAAIGFNSIEIRLEDNSPRAAEATLADVRSYLDAVAPEMTYLTVPDVREPGSWHGRDQVFRMLPLLYVIALMALASALILVAATVNALIAEQTSEIGIMKAVGAGRRAILACYLRSALLLGAIGTAVGTAAGAFLSSALGRLVQQELGGISPTWRLDPWFLGLGVTAGLGGTALAALPSLRRAMRMTVRDALHGRSDGSRHGLVERATRRVPLLSSPTRLGLRNTARRRSRSLAAVAQVALGVGTALAFGAFSVTALAAVEKALENEAGDLVVYQENSLFDDDEARLLASRPGVAAVQPIVYSAVEFGGEERPAWGLPADTIYEPDLSAGRWFTRDEVDAAEPIAVLGRPLAAITDTAVGDRIEIGTRNGVETVQVIGIDESLVHDGEFVWLPLGTAKALEEQPHPNVYWVETASPEPAMADGVAADIRATFESAMNPVSVEVSHERLAAVRAEDRIVIGVIQAFGFTIVAIGMIGLVSAMTAAVLERTREIGVLRAVGARARHVRTMFRAEGTALAVAGWLLGIPVGYLLARVILWSFGRSLHTSFSLLFPPWLPLVALAGVVVVARLALRAPLRRAVRMRPTHALRYGHLGAMAIVIALAAVACGGSGEVTETATDRFGAPIDVTLPPADDLQATLDAGLTRHGGKGFSFAVIMPDGQRWVGVSGVSHGTTAVTPDMPFAAGSITKTWTAAAILQLAEEGVLTLEDPLSKWLPPYPNVDGTITIRQLLNHTSGVHNYIDHRDYWRSVVWTEPGRWWTPDEALRTYLLEPYFAPGEGWHYSNSGYVLLRMILTEATESDVATVYRTRFFDPLGLDRTFVVPDEELPANTAHGWWDLDGDGAYDDFSAVPYTAFASGVGGQVFATAENLADWTHALYHEQGVLSPESFAAMVDFHPIPPMEDEPLADSYGLGSLRLSNELVNGLEVWGHGGNAPGYAAGAFYLPDYGVTMAFTDNTELGDAMPLIDDMMGLILGMEIETP